MTQNLVLTPVLILVLTLVLTLVLNPDGNASVGNLVVNLEGSVNGRVAMAECQTPEMTTQSVAENWTVELLGVWTCDDELLVTIRQQGE